MQEIYDMVIIGGGPGGIGAAVESKILGLDKILMIEKGDNHSQTIRRFYKDNKRVDKDYKGQVIELAGHVDFKDGTKESTLNYFDSLLDNDELDAVFNSEVEKIKKDGDIFQIITTTAGYASKNVIVAIGTMGKPNKPSYKIPLSLKSRVNFNLDKCSEGEKLLLVGGGNSAAEYAIELSKTNTVTLNYRRDKFTRLNDINEKMILEFNGEEKLRLRMGVDIESLENENGLVKVNYTDGYHTVYDRVIYAIGGTTPIDFLRNCGITFDENNKAEFDENYETKTKGLYLAGDIAVRSGGSIALALNHAHHIIEHILSTKK
ncbi:NAD(P)-binding domain-containing protein [Sulfurospirillum arcachonense]|uniref:NAD(P)-binding domain-containing protein n=1 Tax=Sulfurospirillum arcachonense TaxID=57666 RepID=UPI00046ABDC9|nr:NAD(P)-binding domain-containing protein [Sulfurospirillum arcachonense]